MPVDAERIALRTPLVADRMAVRMPVAARRSAGPKTAATSAQPVADASCGPSHGTEPAARPGTTIRTTISMRRPRRARCRAGAIHRVHIAVTPRHSVSVAVEIARATRRTLRSIRRPTASTCRPRKATVIQTMSASQPMARTAALTAVRKRRLSQPATDRTTGTRRLATASIPSPSHCPMASRAAPSRRPTLARMVAAARARPGARPRRPRRSTSQRAQSRRRELDERGHRSSRETAEGTCDGDHEDAEPSPRRCQQPTDRPRDLRKCMDDRPQHDCHPRTHLAHHAPHLPQPGRDAVRGGLEEHDKPLRQFGQQLAKAPDRLGDRTGDRLAQDDETAGDGDQEPAEAAQECGRAVPGGFQQDHHAAADGDQEPAEASQESGHAVRDRLEHDDEPTGQLDAESDEPPDGGGDRTGDHLEDGSEAMPDRGQHTGHAPQTAGHCARDRPDDGRDVDSHAADRRRKALEDRPQRAHQPVDGIVQPDPDHTEEHKQAQPHARQQDPAGPQRARQASAERTQCPTEQRPRASRQTCQRVQEPSRPEVGGDEGGDEPGQDACRGRVARRRSDSARGGVGLCGASDVDDSGSRVMPWVPERRPQVPEPAPDPARPADHRPARARSVSPIDAGDRRPRGRSRPPGSRARRPWPTVQRRWRPGRVAAGAHRVAGWSPAPGRRR